MRPMSEMRFELNIDIDTSLNPEQVARLIKSILADEMEQGGTVRVQSVIPILPTKPSK